MAEIPVIPGDDPPIQNDPPLLDPPLIEPGPGAIPGNANPANNNINQI